MPHVASGGFWPSQSSLLTGLTPALRRHAAFAQQRVTMNLGVGLGALVGGLIATTDRPSSFTLLFLIDAATFLAFVAILSRVRPPERGAGDGADVSGGYRQVLRHGAFVRFALLNVIFIAAGIAPLVELFPAFAKNQGHVGESAIGLIFFLNTVVIVLAQLPIAKLLEGTRRMRVLAGMSALWAASWLLVLAGGAIFAAGAAATVFVVALTVFAIGECLHGVVQGPLVADLAPAHLTGRYMAISSLTWQIGFVVGPAGGGFLLGAAPFALWPLAAAICVVAGAYALALERGLPARLVRTPGGRATPALVPDDVAV